MILKAVRVIAQYSINFLADTDGVFHEIATGGLYKICTNNKNLNLKKGKTIKSAVPLTGILKNVLVYSYIIGHEPVLVSMSSYRDGLVFVVGALVVFKGFI
jgi:hypothetical protein